MISRVLLVRRADSAHATATINARQDRLVNPVKMVKTELQVFPVNLDNRVCLATIRQSTTTLSDAVVHVRTVHQAHRVLQVHQEILDQLEVQVHQDHLVNQDHPDHPVKGAAVVLVNQADQAAPVQLDNRDHRADAVNLDRKDQAVHRDRRDYQVPLEIQAIKARWVVRANRDRLVHRVNAVLQARQVSRVDNQHRVAMLPIVHVHVVQCSQQHAQDIKEWSSVDSAVEMIRQHSIMLKMLLVVVSLCRFERNKL
jgi:hypothetical protein